MWELMLGDVCGMCYGIFDKKPEPFKSLLRKNSCSVSATKFIDSTKILEKSPLKQICMNNNRKILLMPFLCKNIVKIRHNKKAIKNVIMIMHIVRIWFTILACLIVRISRARKKEINVEE